MQENVEKELYTKSEMVALGYAPALLERIAHARGGPVTRTSERGKWLYRKKEVQEFANHLFKVDEERKYQRQEYLAYKRELKQRRAKV